MVKVIIMGGSFDPPHNGHGSIIHFLVHHYPRVQILVVPAKQSPHKNHAPHISTVHRVELLKRAFHLYKRVEIIDWELLSTGPSYTLLTVQRVMEVFKLKEKEIGLCIGVDLLKSLDTWYEFQRLCGLVHWIIFPRPERGSVPSTKDWDKSVIKDFAAQFTYSIVDNPLIPVSSSQVRELIAADESYEHLLDPKVYEYINKNKLYRNDSQGS